MVVFSQFNFHCMFRASTFWPNYQMGVRPFISIKKHMYPAWFLGRVGAFMTIATIRALPFLGVINEIPLHDSAL